MSHWIGRIGFLPAVLIATLMVFAAGVTSATAQATNPSAVEETPLESDLSSPAATMRTFRRAVQRAQELRADARQAWEIALSCIDMPAAPAAGLTAEDAVNRRLAAQKLLDVIDRVASDPASELPDAERAAAGGLDAYVFFPQTSSAGQRRVLEKLGKSVSQPIVLVRTAPGTWKFSQRTIEGIDALHEQMLSLPLLSGGGQPVTAMLGPTFDRTRTWGWFVLAGAIFLGLLAGKLVATVLRNAGKRMHSRRWAGRKILFDAVAGPANLALITLGLAIGLRFIYMDGAVATLSLKVIAFLYLIAVGWYLYNLVDLISLLLEKFAERSDSKLDDMVLPLITKTLRIFLIVVFTLVAAQNVFGLDITGWLAGLGIAGLAVSLAAQDSFRNLFGSVTVFFDKPFVVGDVVVYGGETGTIEEIGFRSTRLRLLSGYLMTVPNMKFGDDTVINIARSPYRRRDMDVTITYDTPPRKIEEAIQIVKDILHDPEVVKVGGFDMDKFPPRVVFDELNADSLNIKAIYWYQLLDDPDRNYFTYLEHREMVNLRLMRAFEAAGIEFAFPTQTLYLAGDPKRKLSVEVGGGEKT